MIRVFLAVLLTTAAAVGQEPVASEKIIVPVKTFSTNEGNPETIARILGDQFPGIAFSADAESDTVFARVDGADADRVSQLIDEISIRANRAQLERQARQAAERRSQENVQEAMMADMTSRVEVLQTYQLKHVPAEEAARILNALGFNGETNIAAFGSSLVMRGPASTFEQVSALLKKVDVPQKDGAFTAAIVGEVDLSKKNESQLLANIYEQIPEQEVEVLDLALEEQLQALSNMLIERPDSGDTKKIEAEMSKVVQQQFRMKMDKERRELVQIQRKLQQITQRLELQERLVDQIVKQRVDQLLVGKKQLLMQQNRELAEVQKELSRPESSRLILRDHQQGLQQLEAALHSLQTEELRRGVKLTGDQAKMEENLKRQYRALKSALELEVPGPGVIEVAPRVSDRVVRENSERAREEVELTRAVAEQAEVERDKALIQLQQVQAELEVSKELQKRNGKKLEERSAKQKAMLEQAREELERQLRPAGKAKGRASKIEAIKSNNPSGTEEASEELPPDQPVPELEVETI